MKEEIILKACPFCGGTDVSFATMNFKESQYQDTTEAMVLCNTCEATGPVKEVNIKYERGVPTIPGIEEIIKEQKEAWNKRHEPWTS